MLIVAEENSHICLEGDNYSATDNYFSLQSIYTQCLEGENITFQKGNTIWLGRKRSEETKKKMSEVKIGEKNPMFGKHLSEDHRNKISIALSGTNHPFFGKHQSEETRNKISKSNKGRQSPFKGINGRYSEDVIKKISNSLIGNIPWNKNKITGNIPWNKGKNLSEKTCDKISKAKKGKAPWNKGKPGLSGEKHPMWKGGISFIPYCRKFNDRLKESVRIRDNRTCQLCNDKENGERLSVHHIHYDKDNCYPDLISLCRKCNSKVDKKDMMNYYEELFMNKLNERGLLLWVYKYEMYLS